LTKRAFDASVAAGALLLLSPLLLVVSALLLIIDGRPVLYRGERVGRDGLSFGMFKFRTMVPNADRLGPGVTMGADPRITRFGAGLRRAKLDELPQLLNVLRGDMSLVGPRPEDSRFVAGYTPEQLRVLDVRPGITSPASIAFRDEQSRLAGATEQDYLQRVLPLKLRLDLEYVEHQSLALDLSVLAQTAATLLPTASAQRLLRRYVPWFVIDGLTVAIAFYASLALRFAGLHNAGAGGGQALRTLNVAIVPIVLLYLATEQVWGLNRRMWRYATASEVTLVLNVCLVATAIAVLVDLLAGLVLGVRDLPLSVVVLGGFLTFTGVVMTRFRGRILRAAWRRRPGTASTPTTTLIYGAGDAGHFVAWRLLTLPEGGAYHVVGFIDDDPRKFGLRIHGLPVLGGRLALPEIVRRRGVQLVVVAIVNIPGEALRDLVTVCQATDAQVKIVPSLVDQVRSSSGPLLREIGVGDLLGRRPAEVDRLACREILEGETVLVTGAAGSIGSELCRQIATFRPAYLLLLDNNESGLFDLALELRSGSSAPAVQPVVADVTDEAKLDHTLAQWRPTVLFHAAAYKHVPLMEEYPEEVVRVNVGGTRTLLASARRHHVSRFVLVSTDKAVHPTSSMGASKRIAEALVLDTAARARGRMLCTAVRFGNVLGSRGSVVPTFARQIELGGPVTVTHPDMTRFFMEIPEAAILILQAATLTRGGDIFMLEMGEGIRIDDLARKMIRMRGLRPDVDIEIVYTGARPGEKIHEELRFLDEQAEPTAHPMIRRLRGHAPTADLTLIADLTALRGNVPDPEEIRRRLLAICDGLNEDDQQEDLGPLFDPALPTIESAE
jgi:FlaA1/EpsC-like NDP-sugar epimerase/lipopolysaccharide/colanic/teichoic acid biosynthesis glycosyltransferase